MVPPVFTDPATTPDGGKQTPSPAAAQRGVTNPWLLAALLVAAVALVMCLIFGGAAAARSQLDPGPVVRFGLPVALMVNNLAAATVIGCLIFAVVILPKDARPARRVGRPAGKNSARLNSAFSAQRTPGGSPQRTLRDAQRPAPQQTPEHPAFSRALMVASGAAVVWALAAIANLIESYLDQAGVPLEFDDKFTAGLVYFITDLSYGQAWLSVAIFAAVVATLCFGLRSLSGLAATLVIAFLGVVPQALIGHSASSPDHEGAVNSLFLHIAGVTVWMGGIIALAVVSGKLSQSDAEAQTQKGKSHRGLTATVLKRFSALALVGYFTVFASGVVNAAIRLTSWDELFGTPYGQMIIAKTLFTLLLGVIGYMHRSWIIPRLDSGKLSVRRVLWQLIGVELLIMGATSGIAVALSRSAPPQPTTFAPDTPPAEILSGYPLPPALTGLRWITEWRMDWIWVFVAVCGVAFYVSGMRKLRRRGDSWPVLRGLAWLVGMIGLVYITSGGPSVYGRILFSAHMVDHMALTMIVPIFLVLGAPVTLALKALSPRGNGSRGIREWILVIVHSWFGKLVTHPLFAAANFVLSIIIFYYSPLFGFALREHVGHELMNIHFLITGYLFVLSMIGIDPVPRRFPYPIRLLLLLATMAFHAFFGVALMSSTTLLEASYFGNLGRSWGGSAIADQVTGGGVAWSIGEIPTVVMAVTVAIMWSRSDSRETKRKDRAAERNNDAELNAYNDMFASFNQRESTTAAPGSARNGAVRNSSARNNSVPHDQQGQ